MPDFEKNHRADLPQARLSAISCPRALEAVPSPHFCVTYSLTSAQDFENLWVAFVEGCGAAMVVVCVSFIFFCLTGTVCHAGVWTTNDTRTLEQKIPDAALESMNQNLIVNLNYSPTQVKVPVALPKGWATIPFKNWATVAGRGLYERRYIVALCVALGAYFCTYIFVMNANAYLARTDTWAAWKNDVKPELFCSLNQDDLAKELILEIQRRYSSAENPTDFITPLVDFVRDIDAEILTTGKLSTFYAWLSWFHAQDVLAIDKKCFENVALTHKKVVHIKNTFLLWAAHYKIDHNRDHARPPAFA